MKGMAALFEAGMTLQRPLEPLDLDQIETYQGRLHAYSTVTVFARLRGWSTFSPRAFAT